jgi:cell division protein FtsL
MNTRNISLTTQIKKVIGNRILFCSVAFMMIIFGLTIYDLSNSITQLRSRINEQIKPIEDFVIDQAMINNLGTVELKVDSFNENNSTFKIEWVRKGTPV